MLAAQLAHNPVYSFDRLDQEARHVHEKITGHRDVGVSKRLCS